MGEEGRGGQERERERERERRGERGERREMENDRGELGEDIRGEAIYERREYIQNAGLDILERVETKYERRW